MSVWKTSIQAGVARRSPNRERNYLHEQKQIVISGVRTTARSLPMAGKDVKWPDQYAAAVVLVQTQKYLRVIDVA
jgi:hypothetical protein